MIRVVDYGLGNILAFLNTYRHLNIDASVARTSDDLRDATQLILPGVGAFDYAIKLLDATGMREELERLVLVQRVPVLGVCVGMQILAHGSDEGQLPGLGWIPAHVRAFSSNAKSRMLPMPHMGWNDITFDPDCRLFKNFNQDPSFYFLHSYYFECEHSEHIVATAEYGFNFTCVASFGNIYGVQFHPEKSHHFGVQLLKNFAEL